MFIVYCRLFGYSPNTLLKLPALYIVCSFVSFILQILCANNHSKVCSFVVFDKHFSYIVLQHIEQYI